jgi:Neisseria PilC beta-propeller domain
MNHLPTPSRPSLGQRLQQGVKQLVQRPVLLASVLAAMVGVPTLVVLAQSTTTAITAGSTLGIAGQVVASATGNSTLNGIDTIGAGDTVQWTNYFQSKLASPFKSIGVVTMPAGFKWVNGSVVVPPKTTLRYCTAVSCANGGWSDSEPATGTVVTFVEWTTNPIQTIKATTAGLGTVNFSGTGDGYRVITYSNNLYVVNHRSYDDTHGNGNNNSSPTFSGYIACRTAVDGTPCLGYANSLTIPATNGTAAGVKEDNYTTAYRSIEHLDKSNGNLYTYIMERAGSAIQVRCINLDTRTACMNSVSMGTTAGTGDTGPSAVNPIGSVEKKYYAIFADGRIACFDTDSKKVCEGFGTAAAPAPILPTNWDKLPGWSTTGGNSDSNFENTVLDKKLFVSVADTIRCFDTETRDSCAGWEVTTSGTTTNPLAPIGTLNSNSRLASISPVLTATGSPRGVCTSSFKVGTVKTVLCRTLANVIYIPSANYIKFLMDNQFRGLAGASANKANDKSNGNTFVIKAANSGNIQDGDVTGPVVVSRMFQAAGAGINGQTNYASCFDFVTEAVCDYSAAGATDGRLNRTDGQAPDTYSIYKDTVRKDCMWSVGHTAIANAFNPLTGGPCPPSSAIPSKVNLDVAPVASFQCDGTQTRVNAWGKIRFSESLSWGGQGLTSMSAKIMDANSVVIPSTVSPARDYSNRPFANGAFQLDISEIPFSKYPNLKIELSVTAGSVTLTQDVGFDVTWDGDPQQLCFKTIAPPLTDCQVSIAVTQTNSGIDAPTLIETLNASKAATPGQAAPVDSWGPGVTSTTLRQYPAGSSDPTQIMQTRYDLNNLTGDLWQYSMTLTGLSATASSKASTVTAAARTMYTSKLDSVGALVRTNLVYADLSTDQQTALALNPSGSGIDNKGGDRLKYLRGETVTGFRSRSATNILGMAIDSSPTVLPTGALAGLSDATYPGYADHRKTLARPNRLVLYQSNDGFLNAYKVGAGSNASSTPLAHAFSYMPGFLLKRAQRFTDSDVAGIRRNPYWLDNTPMVAEVNLGNGTQATKDKWTSVVVATQGRGGRGIYALDVKSGSVDKVLFEYDNTSDPDLKDLGYINGQPPSDRVTGADQIARMSDGRFAFITGNGVNSNADGTANSGLGQAFLYIFYLDGGANNAKKWLKIATNDELGNGLGTPRPVYDQATGKVVLVYAGDVKGNLWRFDVKDVTNIKVTKMFKTDAGQSIYTAPYVSKSPSGDCAADKFKDCWMVTFGTGDDFNALSTSNSTVKQALYGVFDKGDAASLAKTYTSADLVARDLITKAADGGVVRREVAGSAISYSASVRGFKIALSPAEHTSANPVMLANRSLQIATTRPKGANTASATATPVCGPADSWLITINPNDGGTSSVEVVGAIRGELSALGEAKLNSQNSRTYLPGLSASLPTGVTASAADTAKGCPSSGVRLNGEVCNCLSTGLTPSGVTCTPPCVNGRTPDGGICSSNSSMVGRMSWREVFGLPK